MTSRYENVPLPSDIVVMMDVVCKKMGYTSRPEFLKDLIRRHIEKLIEAKLLMPDELRRT
jgi:metal-responsive CopG/Arc/MetJ family transcriptional regulator